MSLETRETGASEVVVVDASLAAKWALPEPHAQAALDQVARWAEQGTHLLAPCLLVAEVTNALFKRVVRGEMDLSTARKALSVVLSFPIDLREEPNLAERAMVLAHEHKRPNTYDSHYLALAERYQCEFWTGDRRLFNSVRWKLGWVRWIGEAT